MGLGFGLVSKGICLSFSLGFEWEKREINFDFFIYRVFYVLFLVKW